MWIDLTETCINLARKYIALAFFFYYIKDASSTVLLSANQYSYFCVLLLKPGNTPYNFISFLSSLLLRHKHSTFYNCVTNIYKHRFYITMNIDFLTTVNFLFKIKSGFLLAYHEVIPQKRFRSTFQTLNLIVSCPVFFSFPVVFQCHSWLFSLSLGKIKILRNHTYRSCVISLLWLPYTRIKQLLVYIFFGELLLCDLVLHLKLVLRLSVCCFLPESQPL